MVQDRKSTLELSYDLPHIDFTFGVHVADEAIHGLIPYLFREQAPGWQASLHFVLVPGDVVDVTSFGDLMKGEGKVLTLICL